jgi:hypothetical protein
MEKISPFVFQILDHMDEMARWTTCHLKLGFELEEKLPVKQLLLDSFEDMPNQQSVFSPRSSHRISAGPATGSRTWPPEKWGKTSLLKISFKEKPIMFTRHMQQEIKKVHEGLEIVGLLEGLVHFKRSYTDAALAQ